MLDLFANLVRQIISLLLQSLQSGPGGNNIAVSLHFGGQQNLKLLFRFVYLCVEFLDAFLVSSLALGVLSRQVDDVLVIRHRLEDI